MRRHVPNMLSWARIALIPVCFWLFSRSDTGLFVIAYVLAGLTDLFDGFLARRWRVMSPAGSLLDSTADALFDISIMVWSYWSVPQLWTEHGVLIMGLFGFYALNVLIGFVKFGRLISYHTYVGKSMAVMLFVFGLVSTTAGYVPALVYAAAGVFFLFCAEAFLLTMIANKRVHDVKSVLHLWRRK